MISLPLTLDSVDDESLLTLYLHLPPRKPAKVASSVSLASTLGNPTNIAMRECRAWSSRSMFRSMSDSIVLVEKSARELPSTFRLLSEVVVKLMSTTATHPS